MTDDFDTAMRRFEDAAVQMVIDEERREKMFAIKLWTAYIAFVAVVLLALAVVLG